MKRTNLVLDGKLLLEATRILGCKTYSATVNEALREAIRFRGLQQPANLQGSGLWEGDLPEMRRDAPARRPRQRRGIE